MSPRLLLFISVFMILTPFILVFMQLEQNQSVHKDTSTDFRAGMRKVQAVASYVFTMSQIHIVHISLYFSAGGVTWWREEGRGGVDVRGLERFITLVLLESSKITNHLLQLFINYKVERRETQPTHQTGTRWLTGVAGVQRCLANRKQKQFGHLCRYQTAC